jgi:hypothetical protein
MSYRDVVSVADNRIYRKIFWLADPKHHCLHHHSV